MFCPQCGKTVSNQKPYCKFCGARLGGAFAPPAAAKPGFAPEETMPVNAGTPSPYQTPPYGWQQPLPGAGAAQPPLQQTQPRSGGKSHAGALIALAAVAGVAVIALIAVLLNGSLAPSGKINGGNDSGGLSQSASPSPSGVPTYVETLPPRTQAPQTPRQTLKPAPTPIPTPEGYVPENARRYLDAVPEDYLEDFILQGYYREYDLAELYVFTKEELALIRNGQYAMSGEIFDKQVNIDYFGAKSWYWPFADGVDDYLNDCQRYNVSLCKQYERDMGWLT